MEGTITCSSMSPFLACPLGSSTSVLPPSYSKRCSICCSTCMRCKSPWLHLACAKRRRNTRCNIPDARVAHLRRSPTRADASLSLRSGFDRNRISNRKGGSFPIEREIEPGSKGKDRTRGPDTQPRHGARSCHVACGDWSGEKGPGTAKSGQGSGVCGLASRNSWCRNTRWTCNRREEHRCIDDTTNHQWNDPCSTAAQTEQLSEHGPRTVEELAEPWSPLFHKALQGPGYLAQRGFPRLTHGFCPLLTLLAELAGNLVSLVVNHAALLLAISL